MKIFREKDSSIHPLRDKTVSILGYGNQGCAQALNLRDSNIKVIVGNIDDDYANRSVEDGFETKSIQEAAKEGDFLLILTTDESQPLIWEKDIVPGLEEDNVLVWASGYNVGFGLIKPPKNVDVVMVAPRMTGNNVRDLFKKNKGAMAQVSVYQDASGQAWDRMMAIAKGIGATKAGVFESSFREEAELDLFAEQVVWPGLVTWFEECFKLGVENGFPAELMVLELYGSGEASEILRLMGEKGFYRQMENHSTTSQYGTLSRSKNMITDNIKSLMKKRLVEDIKGGKFIKEWSQEQDTGSISLKTLKEEALNSPMSKAEKNILPHINQI